MELNKACVWIVEDNENNALVVKTLLQVAGVSKLEWLKSGEELFNAFKGLAGGSNRPDIILLDIQLPNEDGYAILKRIRGIPEFEGLKVVAVTANVMPQDIVQAREAGFDGFIGKPIDRRQFDTIVSQVLSGESVWRPR
jgi:two-component system cell cycle response regulator DivK